MLFGFFSSLSLLSTVISLLSTGGRSQSGGSLELQARLAVKLEDNRDIDMDEDMATDAQREAIERYRQTEKGQQAQREAQERYAETELGKEALKRASLKYEAENADARREYKRLKQREYRAKQKQQKST